MKKILALAMAAAMSLTIAACGAPASNDTSKNNAPSTPGSQGSSVSTPKDDGSTGGSADGSSAGKYGTFTTIEEGKLLMATNASFPPYEMTDDNGNIIGIDAEIAAAIADKLGLELVIDDIDFDAALISVQENRHDMILAGLTYRDDRDLVMDFTDSYATGYQVIIVKEGDTTIAGTNENLQLIDADGKVLENIQIGVQRGTTGEQYCQGAHGAEHVTSLDNGSLAVQALLNGQVDCVVIDKGHAQEYAKANPGLEILEAEYVIEDYCGAVDEGNDDLLNAINTALNELIDDGTLQQIVDKYITAEAE